MYKQHHNPQYASTIPFLFHPRYSDADYADYFLLSLSHHSISFSASHVSHADYADYIGFVTNPFPYNLFLSLTHHAAYAWLCRGMTGPHQTLSKNG